MTIYVLSSSFRIFKLFCTVLLFHRFFSDLCAQDLVHPSSDSLCHPSTLSLLSIPLMFVTYQLPFCHSTWVFVLCLVHFALYPLPLALA